MEIEIVTTKKKLSQSLIKQMPVATVRDMNFILTTTASIYGYVSLKEADFAICKGNFDWVKVDISIVYYKSTSNPLTLTTSYNTYKEFNTQEERDLFFVQVNQIKMLAKSNHIYL